ncbi:hypothetical protein [Streptomyces sp. NPDC051636]|uniref:hypothetical protein n=1 Tax=Streptomyces sp. NPDC051636 TaxID=3365663 RepID=UPI0037B55ACB
MSGGARRLWRHPALRPLVMAGGAAMLFGAPSSTTAYAVVDSLGHSPACTGVLYAVQGTGSVAVGRCAGSASGGSRWAGSP